MAFQLKLRKKHVYDINIINPLIIIFATLGILADWPSEDKPWESTGPRDSQ